MKIVDFVNSKDIRKYWEEIGYELSPLESAWLIWQSKNHTVKEKHAAWRNILHSTEDTSIPVTGFATPQPPLHEFLERYIGIETDLISAFYRKGEAAVYSYHMYFDDGDQRDWYNVNAIFRTFDEAYAHSFDDEEPPFSSFVEFVKTYIGEEGRQIFVRFNAKKEIVRVDETNYLTSEKDFDVFQYGFQEMSFAFPTPFKRGDVLKKATGKYVRDLTFFDACAFDSVVEEFGYTVVKGYMIDNMGEVHLESVHNYMDLERISSPLPHRERLLTPISKYLSGEIDLVLLIGACRYIAAAADMRTAELSLNYSKEEKRLAGVNNES